MRLVTKTWVLLAAVVALGSMELLSLREEMAREQGALVEAIPALAPSKVRRIEISTALEKIRLERVSAEKDSEGFDQWRIVTPIEAEADSAQITALLRVFAGGIPIEAHVEDGGGTDWKQYGLEDQDARLLELFGEGDVPVISVLVGRNTVGSTSFIRIPGTDEVVRADVGGRARLDRAASEWRNRQVLLLDGKQVSRFTIARERADGAPETLVFVRGPSTETDKAGRPVPGAFALEGAPGGLTLDSEVMEAVVDTLAKIRAGAFQNPDYDAGMDDPAAEAVLQMNDGTSHRIRLGNRSSGEASFLRVDDRPEVVRAASQIGRVLLAPVTDWRDRALLRLERADIEGMALTDGGLTVVLAPETGTDRWTVTQPANLDADQVAAEQMFGIVGTLRAAGLSPDAAFAPTGTRLEIRMKDGRRQSLEWGQRVKDADGRPMVQVRLSGRPEIWLLREITSQEIKRAFGRG